MCIRRRVALLLPFFVAIGASVPAARGDVAATYQKTLREVNELERQLAAELGARHLDAFASHFAVSDEEIAKLRNWFGTLTESWADDDLDRIQVDLPLLAVKPASALTHLGHIDIHLKNGVRERHGWPPLVLERRDGSWVFVTEALSPISPSPGAEVTHAKFDVTPHLDSNGLSATARITVENKTAQTLDRVPIYIRYPLELVEATLNGRPLEADTTYGELDGRPTGLLMARLQPALKLGASANLKFRYSATYDYHDLGRKPVGFTADRGFILWEAGWYPRFSPAWRMIPYDMTITVPDGYKALTNGELLDQHDEANAHIYSYRTTRPAPPFILWGRYKETPCQTGDVEMTVWTPVEGNIDPQPMAKLVSEAFAAFHALLPPPALERHRIVAVTRYGGYGPTGNLLLHDPTFSTESIAKTSTLDFVAHELSHSWVNSLASPTGDPPSVLGEGLATYLGAKAVERSRGREPSIAVWRDNLASFHRVARRVVAPMDLTEQLRHRDNPMFRAVAYVKGAYLFRELESLVGEEVVFRALRELLLENKGGHFTLNDLTNRLDRLTDKDLTPFWQAYLHEAAVADYAIESAGPDDSLDRIRVCNHGHILPTPVEVVAYDENMREVARERVVVSSREGPIVKFASEDRIAHIVVDPDQRVLQAEGRNDRYPDCVLPDSEAIAVESLMKRMFGSLREGDFAALSSMFTENTDLLDAATRQRMLVKLKRAIPLSVTENGPMRIYQTGDRQAAVTVGVKLDMGGTARELFGEFTLVKNLDGWKLVQFSL